MGTTGSMKTILASRTKLRAVAVAIALVANPAAAGVGVWVDRDVVEVRLVATARGDGEAPVAAIEIQLDPGWKTYWRTPGESGLPPIFDFSESQNVTAAEIGYPAPRRYNDGYSISNVYEGRVIFPITLAAEDPTKSMTLHLTFDLGVCDTICIPMQLETSVTFEPNAIDATAIALFDEAIALLPNAPTPDEFEVVDFELVTKDGAVSFFEATAIVPQPFGTELFVEGPRNWWPTAPQQTARDGNRLTFAFSFERPDATEPLSGTVFTFTLISAGNAIEQKIVLS